MQVNNMNEKVLAEEWRRQGWLLGIFMLLLMALYYPSYSSMVSIWERSETFAHGFLMLPVSLWLIWRIRTQVSATVPQANYLGIPVLIMLGFLWLVANYVGILAIEQLAATLMIPVLVFTLLGWQATSMMAFPLFFILFAVPIGEELTPYLINATADATVVLIQLVGIPILREGNYFELPTGNWSVVAACSGIRYLIASATLGVLYAYLNYHSLLKRLIFIAASIVIPIIANWLRAFMIVMIGHFSDMQLATGVDHLIYGWVFFGIVIAIMFYIGSFWRDDDNKIRLPDIRWTLGNINNGTLAYKITILMTGIAIVVWPVKFQLEDNTQDISQVAEIRITTPAGWDAKTTGTDAWKPAYHDFDREFSSVYKNREGGEVTLFIGYYAQQRQGAELGNYDNVLVAENNDVWRAVDGKEMALPVAGIKAPTAVIKGNSTQLLTTYIFYVDGQWAANKYETKWLQTKARLLGGRNDGAFIAITSQYQGADDAAVKLINGFASVALEEIKSSMDGMQ